MPSIDIKKQSARAIDREKLKLEAASIPRIKSILSNIAKDSEALYLTTGNIPSQELAKNYEAELIKEIRDIYRKTIKKFGFTLRDTIEKKHAINFNHKLLQSFIGLELKEQIEINDPDLGEKEQIINNEFLAAATFFVANTAESRSSMISNTNAKEIDVAKAQEQAKFSESLNAQQREITKLEIEEASRREIDSARRQLDDMRRNERAIVAKNIKNNLLDKREGRSDLIAEQEVGLSESWARQTEAELIDDAGIINAAGQAIEIEKEWVAILDSKTRDDHVQADGQVVPLNEDFTVGGEQALFPRDQRLSAGQAINCRCISSQSVIANSKSLFHIDKKALADINLKPTQTMANNAKRGLEFRKEHGRGGTAVGVARARDISNRKTLSPKTVGRMVSYFARHEVDKEAEGFRSGEDGYPSNGLIAWLLWGGDAGRDWANRKWEQIKRERDDN